MKKIPQKTYSSLEIQQFIDNFNEEPTQKVKILQNTIITRKVKNKQQPIKEKSESLVDSRLSTVSHLTCRKRSDQKLLKNIKNIKENAGNWLFENQKQPD